MGLTRRRRPPRVSTPAGVRPALQHVRGSIDARLRSDLARLGADAWPALLDVATDPDAGPPAHWAFVLLHELADAQLTAPVLAWLHTAPPSTAQRPAAIAALAHWHRGDPAPLLARMADAEGLRAKVDLAHILAANGPNPGVREAFEALLPSATTSAASLLAKLGDPQATPALIAWIRAAPVRPQADANRPLLACAAAAMVLSSTLPSDCLRKVQLARAQAPSPAP